MNNILAWLFGRSGWLEIYSRRPLKLVNTVLKTSGKRKDRFKTDAASIEQYRNELVSSLLSAGINDGDVVLIHSSMDGLSKTGLDAIEIIDLLQRNLGSNTTIVMPTFPIENKRKKTDGEIRQYNPQKAVCWTGIIPNTFLQRSGVVRSHFPFNSLSAVGPKANEMFKEETKSLRPHDINSAWYYLVKNHAKILFLGTTSLESNTMLDHMPPDVMGDTWPVKNWWRKMKYEIRTPNSTVLREIETEGNLYHKYHMSYYPDRILRENGLLRTLSSTIPVEIVDDAGEMMRFLIERSKERVVYRIPKKYMK